MKPEKGLSWPRESVSASPVESPSSTPRCKPEAHEPLAQSAQLAELGGTRARRERRRTAIRAPSKVILPLSARSRRGRTCARSTPPCAAHMAPRTRSRAVRAVREHALPGTSIAFSWNLHHQNHAVTPFRVSWASLSPDLPPKYGRFGHPTSIPDILFDEGRSCRPERIVLHLSICGTRGHWARRSCAPTIEATRRKTELGTELE